MITVAPPSKMIMITFLMHQITLPHFRLGNILDEPRQPATVQILNVQGTSSSSIKVSWKLVASSTDMEVDTEVNTVDGFYILYRSCIGEPPGFTSITVLHAAATSYVVNRLEAFTPYEFLVIPFHRGLSGKPSALHRAQTLEARPHIAPTGLQWYQVRDLTCIKVRYYR